MTQKTKKIYTNNNYQYGGKTKKNDKIHIFVGNIISYRPDKNTLISPIVQKVFDNFSKYAKRYSKYKKSKKEAKYALLPTRKFIIKTIEEYKDYKVVLNEIFNYMATVSVIYNIIYNIRKPAPNFIIRSNLTLQGLKYFYDENMITKVKSYLEEHNKLFKGKFKIYVKNIDELLQNITPFDTTETVKEEMKEKKINSSNSILSKLLARKTMMIANENQELEIIDTNFKNKSIQTDALSLSENANYTSIIKEIKFNKKTKELKKLQNKKLKFEFIENI